MIDLRSALRLMLVTDDALLAGRDAVDVCQAAIRGGVTSVQLRLKLAPDHDLLAVARRLVSELPVPVIVNDRLDIAVAAGAAGVHLGSDDLAPALARAVSPAMFVIGASVGADTEVVRGGPADYWGIGPLRASATKPDAGAPLGLEGATRIRDLAGERPCVIIGGVGAADVGEATRHGFAGVAVAGGILADPDPEGAARRYRETST